MSKAVFAILGAVPILFAQSPAGLTKMGHSIHGETYDVGPWQRPWLMDGTGTEHYREDPAAPKREKERDELYRHRLEEIWWKYPDDLELHSTILIDKNGRVIWSRNGGDPFTDFDFLVNQIKRANQM